MRETFEAKAINHRGVVTATAVRDTVEGAMDALKATYIVVRGEFTSDGHHWGPGRGRIVATYELGRWLRD